MSIPAVEVADVRTVCCVGAGVIGGGWAAYFLARGYDVVAWDPAPTLRTGSGHLVDVAWPALTSLGLAEGADRSRLRVEPLLADALAGAEFVQESAPEDLDLKTKLLAEIDAAAPEGVVISSSTSGYGMSEMQVGCADPGRTIVGHPFNPPYLIPLVEVVGGAQTSPEVVAWTSDFYRHVGKSVITMDREVPGFIANRLQEALWREALHMVAAGEATVEQIDLSITDGPGLRWPIQGRCSPSISPAQGGMAHMLDHFGPSLQSPWTRLMAAELTPALRDAVVEGCDREADGRTVDDLVAERDAGVIAVLRALGAGVTDPVVWTEPALDEWIDYNGHLSEPYYVLVLGHATDAVMEHVGLGPSYRSDTGASLFTVEAHVRYLDQVPAGVDLDVRSSVIGASGKLLRIWHELYVDGTLRATEEVLGVHVDTRTGRSTPFPGDVARRITDALVDPPPDAGRSIRVLQR